MADDDLIEASPCKLRNGNWGCKTATPVAVGDAVRIVTRANKQWRAEITKIVWTDDTVCICETESADRSTSGTKTSAPSPSAKSKSTAGAKTTGTAAEVPDAALGEPTYSADVAPTAHNTPSDELDAMADRAAAEDDESDDWLSAFDEIEREQG